MKKVIGLVIAMFLVTGNVKADENSFYQHWVHSGEEQNGQATPNIFRPKGSMQFPPSNFRMEYAFNRNGQCLYKFKSQTGAHQMRNCLFTKVGNMVYFYEPNGVRLSHLALTIQVVNGNVMQFAYGTASPSPDKKVN